MNHLMTLKEASLWASQHVGKNVTASNISYLIQYGKIHGDRRHGGVRVNQRELERYYDGKQRERRTAREVNWKLSFSEFKESETTKHVHRLHPYKGKFIPQLAAYFLGAHTDDYKKESFFNGGDVVLDPFCGSGTTLVQANELNMHAVGIDISEFNAFISNVKIGKYDLADIKKEADAITRGLVKFQENNTNVLFERRLLEALTLFNQEFFPSPAFKWKIARKEIDEAAYGAEKAAAFVKTYDALRKKHGISLHQKKNASFLDNWFLPCVRAEIDYVLSRTQLIANAQTKRFLLLVLSRVVRSCRATTHADLGTLIKPVKTVYYCKKHGKICKPLFTILHWWRRYAADAALRAAQFEDIKTDSCQICLTGDGRTIDIVVALEKNNPGLARLAQNGKISGIFSSPPYVGLIDYHEQHAYAYDLLGFTRRDQMEIGPLCKGQGRQAQQSYVRGVADVLLNCKKWMKKDYHVFLVANDKYRLYPQIASLCGMKIVNDYKRPVLNRVEKNRNAAYAETIFHLREN